MRWLTTGWFRTAPADAPLMVMTLAFVMTGIVVVFSATSPAKGYSELLTQVVHAVAGAVVCLALSCVKPEFLRRRALRLYALTVIFMVLPFTPLGIERNGAERWVWPGFQPSELAKLAVILVVARCALGAPDWPRKQRDTYLACMTLILVMCALCLAQRDLGSAVMVFLFGLIVLYFAGLNPYALSGTITAATAMALGFARLQPYRWERITAFLDPTRDPKDTGYQIARMLCTVSRGGVLGQGLGLSREKWLGVPAIESDSIYCVVAAEFGFIGGVALLLAFLYYARRAISLAEKQPDAFSRVLMASLGSALALQALVNMAVATGTVPCTGLTLPFISAGGSSLVCCLAAAGILLALSRQVPLDQRDGP